METKQHDVFMTFLQEEGYCPELEPHPQRQGEYRILFRSEGVRYFIYLDDADPGYLRVGVRYSVPGQPPRGVLLRLAHKVETSLKAVKLAFDDDGVYVNVEQFFEAPDGFKPTFWRCVSIVCRGADDFFSALSARRPRERQSPARRAARQFLAEFEDSRRS